MPASIVLLVGYGTGRKAVTPGLFSLASDGAPATEDGLSSPSLRSPRTRPSALLVIMTGENGVVPHRSNFRGENGGAWQFDGRALQSRAISR